MCGAPDRQRLVAAMLRAIAHHAVGDRPFRVEQREQTTNEMSEISYLM